MFSQLDNMHHEVDIFGRSITTVVANSVNAVDMWILSVTREICNSTEETAILGLALETAADGVATIQLTYDHYCLIYRILSPTSFPLTLKRFLSYPDVTFVGFRLQPKLDMLTREAPFNVQYRDLGLLARDTYERLGPPSGDLTSLATHVLESVDVVWPHPGGRWDSPGLTYTQARYACARAYVSLQIGRLLLNGPRMVPERFVIRVVQEDGPIEQVHEVQIFDETVVTTVTNRVIAVEKWVAGVTHDGRLRVVGFDVEVITVDGQPQIATVQLCVGSRCLVVQFLGMNGRYMPGLERFLLRDNNTFVGVDIIRKMDLFRHWLLFAERGRLRCIDTGVFAADTLGRPEMRTAAPHTLVRHLFGLRVEIPHLANTDWLRDSLSFPQVVYLCINAVASYETGLAIY